MSLFNKRLSRDPYASLKSPVLAVRMPHWRSKLVMALIIVSFGALVGRALWVQIIDRDFYTTQGQKRYQLTLPLDATRGRIVDRHGALLAVSVATYEIWATPGLIKPQTVAPLAKLLEKRVYPEGESVAQIVGFTDLDNNGLEGVELALNEALKGDAGTREVVRDRLGRILYDARPVTPARHGDTIRLTIDRRIQQLAYAQLEAAVKQHQAKAGSVVVLDARDGEILAMANWPTFDPNERGALPAGQIRNRSTIKPMIVALALDAGKVQPDTLIDTSPGTYRIGRNVIHDTSNHGVITVEQTIQKSSNVAMAKLALSLPAQVIWSKYQEYGFGHPPTITFPGAAPGKLRPHKHWYPIDQATHAYGYGLSMSLMQIAQAYTAFAGDGVMKPARLVIKHKPDSAVTQPCAVTSPRTAASIRTMLEMAVGPGGTARAAMVNDYRAGGKTGTARKMAGTSYAKGKYRALFVGMAPMSDPRVIVAVMIDEPAGRSFYGGKVAGPVFATVAGESLQLLGVPPDAHESDRRG
ncbi:hypothetical protein DFQ30_008864 [Apophysomyces sp. BC1015]|nr:hypothetical protein DFQ30_008864 [Apophysomyces sp. BC1015]